MNSRSYIFTNLPIEIEELIFKYRTDILLREKEIIKKTSTKVLLNEIIERCGNINVLHDHKQYSTYNNEKTKLLINNLDISSNEYKNKINIINFMIFNKINLPDIILS